MKDAQKQILQELRDYLFKKERSMSVSESLAEGLNEVLHILDQFEEERFGETPGEHRRIQATHPR